MLDNGLANETSAAIASDFVRFVYMSDFFYAEFSGMMGVIGGISIKSFLLLRFPLPPLAEQHRIVAKVDELMALCDRLEATLAETDATRRRRLEALLHEALAPSAAREI